MAKTAVAASGWRALTLLERAQRGFRRWCNGWVWLAGVTRSQTAYLTSNPQSSLVPTCACIAPGKLTQQTVAAASLGLMLLSKLLEQSCHSRTKAPFALPAIQPLYLVPPGNYASQPSCFPLEASP